MMDILWKAIWFPIRLAVILLAVAVIVAGLYILGIATLCYEIARAIWCRACILVPARYRSR